LLGRVLGFQAVFVLVDLQRLGRFTRQSHLVWLRGGISG
jgi:hypothetical protein